MSSISESDALDGIWRVLEAAQWNRGTSTWYLDSLQQIAELVRGTGRGIEDIT